MAALRPYTRDDLGHSPMIVFYETTRACDLLCRHCRACAQPQCDPNELTTTQALSLVDELMRFPRPPLLVLTGGDPLKRPDIFRLVQHATERGLEVAMTPSATPLVTAEAVGRLKLSGLHRLALSLDGSTARSHDSFRGVAGSFARTLEILGDARAAGLPVQVNTTVGRHNVGEIEAIAGLLEQSGIVLWSIFFLVPTGRATADQRLDADEVEAVFERLWRIQQRVPYAVKTTEAPHYRRFVLQKSGARSSAASPAHNGAPPERGGASSRHVGTNDGKGVLFVSHVGQIYPSGFLPIECGRFPLDSVVRVYQHSALFKALRDGDRLGGKCGACEYRNICGGSRARSFALTDDPLAAEPDCSYVPPRWRESASDTDVDVARAAPALSVD